MEITTIDLKDIKPHPKNPNQHPKEQLIELQNSLDQFDQVKNIVTWKGYIIAGHGLVEAAKLKGLKTIKAVDVSTWPEEKAMSFMVADNRLPELGIMDDGMLTDLLKEFDDPLDIPGIDDLFLDALMIDGQENDDPDEEWEGMPEFNQEDQSAFRTLKVHFKNQQDVDEFAELIKQKITNKTKYLWAAAS